MCKKLLLFNNSSLAQTKLTHFGLQHSHIQLPVWNARFFQRLASAYCWL